LRQATDVEEQWRWTVWNKNRKADRRGVYTKSPKSTPVQHRCVTRCRNRKVDESSSVFLEECQLQSIDKLRILPKRTKSANFFLVRLIVDLG